MHEDLQTSIDDLFPSLQATLEDLVRLPSVSATSPEDVRRCAEAVSELAKEAGYGGVRLLEAEGAHPAVFGEMPGPAGAPTVLLYAHHDVQPPGDGWTEDPFEPHERDGRLYGRGASDDKAGVIMHLAAARMLAGDSPVTIKLFVEGEEEIGSVHLPEFLATHAETLAADTIVIADSGNWRAGVPTFTTSLRGLVDCVIEVRTLRAAIHSGLFGGSLPDSLTVLARTLATLHDEEGRVAVEGLRSFEADPFDLTAEELRHVAGAVDGVELIGEGTLTSRLWSRPSISVLALDAPAVDQAINALIPVARAKVSMRLAPGQDPAKAMKALIAHLEANVPWGAEVTVTEGASGEPFSLATTGPAYNAFRVGFAAAWGREPVETGMGGSIPFVAAFSEMYPEADILLIGAGDSTSAAHGPDESVDLDDLKKACLGQAIALRELTG